MDMNRKSMLYLTFVLLVGLVLLWGCPKKTETATSSEAQPQTMKSASQTVTSDGMQSQTQTMKSEESNEKGGVTAKGLKPVYFDFDKSFIRADAKAVMKVNVEWLKANAKTKIKIEGNCDERGTKEYNQALGQRRAANAKKYLTDMGISASRISLISYGKEKPICTESTEECWQKNRRDDFVINGR